MNYSLYPSFTPLKNPYILKEAAPYGSRTPDTLVARASRRREILLRRFTLGFTVRVDAERAHTRHGKKTGYVSLPLVRRPSIGRRAPSFRPAHGHAGLLPYSPYPRAQYAIAIRFWLELHEYMAHLRYIWLKKNRTDPSVGRSRVRERGTSGHAACRSPH